MEPKRNSASGHLYFGRDGLIGIIITSVLALLASSATILIPVRALGGIMAALVNPLALAIITVISMRRNVRRRLACMAPPWASPVAWKGL